VPPQRIVIDDDVAAHHEVLHVGSEIGARDGAEPQVAILHQDVLHRGASAVVVSPQDARRLRAAQSAFVLFAVRAAQTLEVDVPVCMRRVLPTVVELDSDNRDVLGSMVRAAQPKAGSLAGDLGARQGERAVRADDARLVARLARRKLLLGDRSPPGVAAFQQDPVGQTAPLPFQRRIDVGERLDAIPAGGRDREKLRRRPARTRRRSRRSPRTTRRTGCASRAWRGTSTSPRHPPAGSSPATPRRPRVPAAPCPRPGMSSP
jgi:hypothetical protein